ncbi:MAG: hypothetical protein E7032_04675 [Akkermansiaceae bacterium]|nr:hypothetical protein [Akkermansiaceae bacterium]
MKAQFLTALCIVAAPMAMADISLGANSPAAVAAAPSATEYVKTAHDVLSVVKELTVILEGVKDQASADAAAAQVGSITARMVELQKKAEAMPRPSAEVESMVRNGINVAEVQQVVSSFMNSFIRIGMNGAYGSQALLNALGPVVNAMPGSQE